MTSHHVLIGRTNQGKNIFSPRVALFSFPPVLKYMDTRRITWLLQQYLDNRLTKEEQEELDRLLQQDDHAGQMRQELEALIDREQGLQDYQHADWDPLFRKIRARTARPVKHMQQRWLTAAAALILFSVAAWLLFNGRSTHRSLAATTSAKQPPAADITPGGNKATLTLADNTTIDLDAAKVGVLGQQGNTQLIKHKDGQLSLRAAGPKATAVTMTYNLLTTPRGGQYQLVLPDGSKVWLNAASRLKFPTSFGGKERLVELQGEAYFEIARNPSMPFKVSLMGDQHAHIEVLGTHFDVKAYADEPAIHATLLEGSVRVRRGETATLLQPGQEARWNSSTDLKVTTADVEETIAWKNGLFKFNEATIEEVMRQLSRWYDVEVVYVNGIPNDLFRGEIYRNVSVSKVLKVLEASGVHFTVEGKKILVKDQ